MNEIVFRLGLVSLFNDISTEMLYPITPIFLTVVLGASMASVGWIEGFSEFLASLLKVYFGQWSDTIGERRPFVIAGYSLSTIARPLIGLAQSWPFVFFARAFDRLGKAVRGAPRDAVLADSVEKKSLGRAFGWHRGMDSLGAVLGPLLALVLLKEDGHHLRLIYFLSAIPALIAVLLVFSVRERRRAGQSAQNSLASQPTVQEPRLKKAQARLRIKNLPVQFQKYLIALGVFSLANSSDAFLLLKMKSVGVSLTGVILLYGFYNVFYSVTSPWLGHLSDRLGRKQVLIFGFVLFACVYLGFTRASSPLAFSGLLAVYGIYMGATEGVGKAWAIDLVASEFKGAALGFRGMVTGLCGLIASVSAGLIWDHFGSSGPFMYGAVGAAISCVLLLFVRSPGNMSEGIL